MGAEPKPGDVKQKRAIIKNMSVQELQDMIRVQKKNQIIKAAKALEMDERFYSVLEVKDPIVVINKLPEIVDIPEGGDMLMHLSFEEVEEIEKSLEDKVEELSEDKELDIIEPLEDQEGDEDNTPDEDEGTAVALR